MRKKEFDRKTLINTIIHNPDQLKRGDKVRLLPFKIESAHVLQDLPPSKFYEINLRTGDIFIMSTDNSEEYFEVDAKNFKYVLIGVEVETDFIICEDEEPEVANSKKEYEFNQKFLEYVSHFSKIIGNKREFKDKDREFALKKILEAYALNDQNLKEQDYIRKEVLKLFSKGVFRGITQDLKECKFIYKDIMEKISYADFEEQKVDFITRGEFIQLKTKISKSLSQIEEIVKYE